MAAAPGDCWASAWPAFPIPSSLSSCPDIGEVWRDLIAVSAGCGAAVSLDGECSPIEWEGKEKASLLGVNRDAAEGVCVSGKLGLHRHEERHCEDAE
ncbi:MAG: hypothetical protein LZF86_200026 [Nitrospira sp.]|nr:MAG: hypothetical protein LZF86_200026 [Nitrospira sp.]